MQCKELLNYIAVYAACQDAVTKKREDLNVLPEVAALVSCATDQQGGRIIAPVPSPRHQSQAECMVTRKQFLNALWDVNCINFAQNDELVSPNILVSMMKL